MDIVFINRAIEKESKQTKTKTMTKSFVFVFVVAPQRAVLRFLLNSVFFVHFFVVLCKTAT